MRLYTAVELLFALHTAFKSPASVVFASHIRKYIDRQLELFKDIATNLKEESDRMPKASQVIDKIKRIDEAEFRKIDARIAKETAELNAEHGSCPVVNYERNYSELCPDGWVLQGDGSCWGEHYKGPCESMHSFKWFTVDEKRRFEQRCCAFWPAVTKNQEGPSALLSALHGSVDPADGHIVPPRA